VRVDRYLADENLGAGRHSAGADPGDRCEVDEDGGVDGRANHANLADHPNPNRGETHIRTSTSRGHASHPSRSSNAGHQR